MQRVHESFQQALREHSKLRDTFQKYLRAFRRKFESHWVNRKALDPALGQTLMVDLDAPAASVDKSHAPATGYEESIPADQAAETMTSAPPINIRMIAHDLRVPLASAALSLQVARDSRTPPEKLEKALDLAEKSLAELGEMIDSLMSSRQDAHPDGRLDLRDHLPCDLIAKAVAQVTSLAVERNLCLSTGELSRLPPIGCEGMQITRVLVNLLSNAIKNTPAGGRITINAAKRNNDGHPAIVFSVEDSGPGVGPELAERIFELGVSIPKEGKPSTGLGLAVCREIVEAHLGRIWVETDRTDGATFSFAIPLDLALHSNN